MKTFVVLFGTLTFTQSCTYMYKWDGDLNKLQQVCSAVNRSADFDQTTNPWNFLSVAQCEQDSLVLKLLNSKVGGYFIDLAANDYKHISNSYSLEKYYNWSGICIEPNPQYMEGILSNRKCKLVVNPVYSRANEIVKFQLSGHESGIVGEDMDNKLSQPSDVEFLTVTLEAVLKQLNAPHVIDYFSLDVEGGEFSVMKNFDFQYFTFLILTIERPTELLHNLLVKHHYSFLTTIRQVVYDKGYYGECVYIHHSIPNFHSIMREYRLSPTNKINTAWRNGTSLELHPYLLRPSFSVNR